MNNNANTHARHHKTQKIQPNLCYRKGKQISEQRILDSPLLPLKKNERNEPVFIDDRARRLLSQVIHHQHHLIYLKWNDIYQERSSSEIQHIFIHPMYVPRSPRPQAPPAPSPTPPTPAPTAAPPPPARRTRTRRRRSPSSRRPELRARARRKRDHCQNSLFFIFLPHLFLSRKMEK